MMNSPVSARATMIVVPSANNTRCGVVSVADEEG